MSTFQYIFMKCYTLKWSNFFFLFFFFTNYFYTITINVIDIGKGSYEYVYLGDRHLVVQVSLRELKCTV